MDAVASSSYDPAAPTEGAIQLLLEQGGLSFPMQGVAKGLLAAECASNLLVRTLSSSRSMSDTGAASPSWCSSPASLKEGLRAPWDDLPEDLWHPIFNMAGFLEPTEAKMRAVLSTQNKTWNRVLNDPQIWQELELITSDFKDPAHFVDALLACFRPSHGVRTLRIAQSPLLRDRPWECAHRLLYGRPFPHTLGNPASSPDGMHALERYLDKAHASAGAAGSLVPKREDPAWAPVYKCLIPTLQGRMFRQVSLAPEHALASIRRTCLRVWQGVMTMGTLGLLLLLAAAMYLVPGLGLAICSATLVWAVAISLHVLTEVATSSRRTRSSLKIAR